MAALSGATLLATGLGVGVGLLVDFAITGGVVADLLVPDANAAPCL